MINKKSITTFNKYNPADQITRCPNGKGHIKIAVDQYVKAAVNLYGVIAIDDFLSIFNNHHHEEVTKSELKVYLLPLIIKKEAYCFYKEYLIHPWLMGNYPYVDSIIIHQSNKPRYIPNQDDFLKYVHHYQIFDDAKPYWDALWEFITTNWSYESKGIAFYFQLQDYSLAEMNTQEIVNMTEEFELFMESEQQVQEFFSIIIDIMTYARFWVNKGYSPYELRQLISKPQTKSTTVTAAPHVTTAAKSSCPCGSGKRYEKCCQLIENNGTAQLSPEDGLLFYETWYELLTFTNQQYQVIDQKYNPSLLHPIREDEIYKLRNFLWEKPEIIDQLLKNNKLTGDKRELLKSWRRYHLKTRFIVYNYTNDYAILMSESENDHRLYAVKGIMSSFSKALHSNIPIAVDTVLLPFKDQIIYDGFVVPYQISFGPGILKILKQEYEKLSKNGIIRSMYDMSRH